MDRLLDSSKNKKERTYPLFRKWNFRNWPHKETKFLHKYLKGLVRRYIFPVKIQEFYLINFIHPIYSFYLLSLILRNLFATRDSQFIRERVNTTNKDLSISLPAAVKSKFVSN